MDNPRINFESPKSILASIDFYGAYPPTQELYSYLVAVRTSALGSVSPLPPSWETYYRVFGILRHAISLELRLDSFNLLIELDKCYPRAYLNNSDSSATDSSGGEELMVNKKMWSPFIVESENFYDEATTPFSDRKLLIDSVSFSILVEDIVLGARSSIEMVEKMLLFQYLVRVLEDDYLFCQTSYNGTLNGNFLRESVVSMLLASRKMNYRNLVHNCMLIASKGVFHETNISLEDLKGTEITYSNLSQSCNVGPLYAFPEFRKNTCVAAQNFLILIMELDLILKETEKSGFTSRAPILETIIDELTYNKNQIFPFLEVFGELKWKLEMILLYLGKYFKKVMTSHEGQSNEQRKGKRKRKAQCYLSLQADPRNAIFLTRMIGESTLLEVCSGLISTFQCFHELDGRMYKITTSEWEALFVAKSIRVKLTHAGAHHSEIIPKLT